MKKIPNYKQVKLLIITILLLPFITFIHSTEVKASKTTPTPIEIPVEYEWERMKDGYGTVGDYGSFKMNLGNRKGTLVFKAYLLDKYEEPYATQHYDAVKEYRYVGIFLRDNNFGINRKPGGILTGFSRYATFQYIENNNNPIPREKYKTINGFQNAGYTINGTRFVGAGVYLPNPMNNGIYYLDLPDSWNRDYWKVKAYLYEDLDVENALFKEFERYFPLLGKVIWEGMELRPGQIGKVHIKVDTPLYKINGNKKIFSRTLKKGEDYRIYAFKPGMLDLGGGFFVNRDAKVEYITPSKAKIELLRTRIE